MNVTTCILPLNRGFELVYLVIRLWSLLLAVASLVCLLRFLLFTCSSSLRVKRLSALLKGLDKQRISNLAEDVDVFFKLESCGAEFKELRQLPDDQQLHVVVFAAALDSQSDVVKL